VVFICADEFRYPNYDQFANLSLKEQKKILIHIFAERVEHSKNIHYRLEHSITYPKLSPDKLDFRKLIRTVEESKSYRVFEHWVLNDTYRMSIDEFDTDKQPIHRIIDVFDQGKGVRKGVQFYYKEESPPTGRIDTVYNPIEQLNTYLAWIGGVNIHGKSFYIFTDLLEHQDEWIIETDFDSPLVRLTTSYPPRSTMERYEGRRTLLLDPMKGFMPIDSEVTWHGKDGNYENWEEQCFIVDESKLVGNIWMPTLMTLYFRTKITAHKFTLIRMKITEIEHGQVTDKDMVFKFPENTRVVDAIQGVSYKTDANGEAIESTIEPLHGLDPSQVKSPEPPKRNINIIFIVAGIVLIVISLYLQFKKRRK
jgi:hypothetical protein